MSDDGDFGTFDDFDPSASSGGEGGGGTDPLAVGAAWAIHGLVTDNQTRKLKESFDGHQTVTIEEPKPTLINAAENQKLEGPQTWDAFIGQERVKQQLAVHINSAKARGKPLDHTLLSSGVPGVGKTSLAHLIAKEMDVYLMKLVPPFHRDTLFEAAQSLPKNAVLFIDEALALDTPIPTPSGWTTMGELRIGDEVLGARGQIVRVVRLTPITQGITYRLTFDDGETIIADAGHRWFAAPKVQGGTNYLKPRVVTTQGMVDSNRPWRIPLAEPVELPEADLPIDPYVLGQWLGNGNTGQGYVNVRPELVTATTLEFETAGEQVTNLGPIGSLIRLSLNDARQGDRTRSSFRNRMEALGIYTDKAVPSIYLRGSLKQRLRLVQGLMDTDGYVSPRSNCTFSSTTEALADAMVELLRSLGYTPRKHLTKDKRIGAKGVHQPCWKVEFRGVPDVNPFLLRDAGKVQPRKHKNMRRIVSIEPVDSTTVRCVEVDSDDHLFLAGLNWTVTHNCHKLADGGPRMAENLLHMMEERRIYTDDGVVELDPFTLIGATTDGGKLPEPVQDRFVIKPYFETYTPWDLTLITAQFAGRYMANINDETIIAIAHACRSTPRVARELVMAGRDLAIHYGRSPTAAELFEFKQMDSDGVNIAHKKYLLALYRNFGRKSVRNKGQVEFVAGEDSLRKVLRETKGGLAAIERFLIELGLVDQSPQGRRLTEEGIQRAQVYHLQEVQ